MSESKFAIHEAAREGRTIVVESLLNANPKLSQQVDDGRLALNDDLRVTTNADMYEDGRLAIHWAASYGHLEICKILAQQKSFDPDAQDGSGWTPLMIAASLQEGGDLVDLFLSKEADVNITNFNGQNVLHFVASKSNLDGAKTLLSAKPPVSARVKDKRGQYAIHRAAAVGNVPMVELLLKNRSPINAQDSAGQTPLHHAIAEGHGDTALALLKAGAEVDKKDSDGLLPMDLAPDTKVRRFIKESAEKEGIDL